MHATDIKALELVSYTHKTGETLIGCTQTAERNNDLTHSKLIKWTKNGHKITKIWMQRA